MVYNETNLSGKEDFLMIIDAHNHPNWYYMTADKMVANMDAYGIDKCWLLSCEIPEGEYFLGEVGSIQLFGTDMTNMPFENCIKYAEKYPDRFILGYAPDPRRPQALERLQYARKTYGVKVCGEVKFRMMLDDYDAVRMYRYCGEEGMPVTVHLQVPIYPERRKFPRDAYWYSGNIDALERVLKLCPETAFLGHAQSFWAEISGDGKAETDYYPSGKVVEGGKLIRLLETYPNLYCDISAGSGRGAFSRDPEFAAKFFNTYQDRVLFARDTLDNGHQELLRSLGLSDTVLDKIFYQNAQKLIRD